MHTREDLEEFQTLLGLRFHDVRLLDQARTVESAKAHCRHCRQDPSATHYRVPEWGGDALLNAIVTVNLIAQHPERTVVGSMENVYKKLTRNTSLGRIGLDLGIGPFVHMGDDKYGGFYGTCDLEILANVMEALVFVIYKDQGGAAARAFVWEHILSCYDAEAGKVQIPKLPKLELAELQKKHGCNKPEYSLLNGGERNVSGYIEAVVWEGGKPLARGTGFTIEDAEQEAARQALLEHFE